MNTRCLIVATALTGVVAQAARAQCCAPDKMTALANSQYAQAALKTVRIEIDGMTCGQCAESINAALKKIDGVQKIDISFEQKGGAVQYDPAKVNEKSIVQAINKTGFKAKSVVVEKG